jgi:hypothetical protein
MHACPVSDISLVWFMSPLLLFTVYLIKQFCYISASISIG